MESSQGSGSAVGTSVSDLIVARLERLPYSGTHRRILLILGAGTLLDHYDMLTLGSALAVAFQTFHISMASTGVLLGFGFLGQFVGAITFGVLSELWGRKKAFILALLIMGVFCIASGLAWSFGSLVAFRALAGIGLGGEFPIASAMMSEFVRARRRGRDVLVYQTVTSWASTIAPLAGFVFIHYLGGEAGWRLLLISGGLPILLAPVALGLLPESVRWLVKKGRHEQAEATVAAFESYVTSKGIALEPVHVQAHADVKPTRFSELFHKDYRRRTSLLWVHWFFNQCITAANIFWIPSLLTRVGHLKPTQSLGLMVVLNVIGLLFAYAVAIWFIEQLGRRTTFTIGWCGYLLGALFGLLSVTLFHAQSSWVVLFIAGTVIHMNIGICGQGTGLYAPELFPTRMRGFATSSGRAVALVAGTISPMVVGWLFASKLGITGYYGFLVVMAIVGLINFRVRGIETRGVMLEELSR